MILDILGLFGMRMDKEESQISLSQASTNEEVCICGSRNVLGKVRLTSFFENRPLYRMVLSF